MPILVKDIMSRPVYTVDVDKTAKDAGELIRKTRRGCVIIVKDGNPVGIVTDSDLIKKVVAINAKADQLEIRDMMSKPLVVVRPDDDILIAVRKMKKSNIHRLPVIGEQGKIIGLISLSDIAKTSPEMLDLLEYRLKMKEMPTEIREELTYGVCDSCGNLSGDLRKVGDQWLCESCRDELEIG